MYLPSHASTGAMIGLYVHNPYLACMLAFASHFVLDAVPHWQLVMPPYKFSWRSVVTLIGTVVATPLLGGYLYSSAPNASQAAVLAAMISACLPDIDDALVVIPGVDSNVLFQKFRAFHNNLQKETTEIIGILFQLIPIIVCFFLIR